MKIAILKDKKGFIRTTMIPSFRPVIGFVSPQNIEVSTTPTIPSVKKIDFYADGKVINVGENEMMYYNELF